MNKRIDKRTWGVLGKQQTYYSPQKQVEGKKIQPLNANAFDSWDSKRSKFKRVDGFENNIQQGGVVPQGTSIPVSPTPTPSITPSQTPTYTPTNTPSPTPTEPYDIYLFEECNNSSNKFRFENIPGILNVGEVYRITGSTNDSRWNAVLSSWEDETMEWQNSNSVVDIYASVIPYSATGLVYSATGISFILQPNCPGITPTPTPSNSPTPSITPSQTPSETPTQTPTITNTQTTTVSPTPSSTPPPFSPSGLTDLQFWFMSSSGSSASSWTNYGSLGGTVVQSVGAFQPQVLTGQTLGSFTGTSMRFANRDFMTGSTTSTSFSAETIFAVVKRTSPLSQGWAITMYNNLNPTSFTGNYVWYYQSYQFPENLSLVNAKPTIVRMPFTTNVLLTSSGDGAFLSATTNGSFTNSATSTLTGSTNVVRLDFGYDPSSDLGQIHDVFEFIAYNRLLSASEYNNVMNYLKTKYQYSTW
jgi:hypothetical protein